MSFYGKYPVGGGSGGGSGITSINADTTAAQVITGSNNISASTAAGTTTINGTLLAPKAAPSFSTSVTLSYATATTVPYLDASKNLISSAVTPTELGYVSGVTSAIQTQLNLLAPKASPAFTTQVTFGNYHLEPSETGSVNSSTAVTLDMSTASAKRVTMTGNSTFTLSNMVAGGNYVINVIGGASNYTVAFAGTVVYLNSTAAAANAVPATTGRLVISVYYDGTTQLISYAGNYAA
jgi:hypothetical protein